MLKCEGGTNGDLQAFQAACCTKRERIKN